MGLAAHILGAMGRTTQIRTGTVNLSGAMYAVMV
jgi:hypothetical protein